MSHFDTNKNKAICVLPWVHEYRAVNGKSAPCCLGKKFKPGEDLQQVRDQMLQGIRPAQCNFCYNSEDQVGWSNRLRETKDWLKKFGEPDIENTSVEYIDLRFDNTCNLKCKTCGPHDSTLWQKEKGIQVKPQNDTEQYFNNLNKKILKKVYLAGGEPTFIPAYLTFLQELHEVNPGCEVIINTNLKRLPGKWKDIIQKFPHLTVVCSCDAIETLGDYVRYPLGWKTFEENVKFVSENANFLQFNLVASNLTTHKLHDTCTWMAKYSNNINLSILSKPEVFSENAVPTEIRQVYLDELQKMVKFPVGLSYASQFRAEVNFLIKKYTGTQYDRSLHDALKMEITEQDSHRRMSLQEADQFLYSWIFS